MTLVIGNKQVSRVGYGMGSLTRKAETKEGFDSGVELLGHALGRGVTFYDTAQFYGNGRANELLRAAFADRREDVCLASKVGARPLVGGPVPMTAAQRPAELRQAVEENLETLGTDYLDLVYMRRMDMLPGLVIDDPEQTVALEEQLEALVAMREEGLIKAIGLSHVDSAQLATALPYGIAAISNIYNLLDRKWEDMLAVAEEHGIVWSPYFPLGGGGFAGLPKVTELPAVVELAGELGATPNQVGLAWLLAHSPQSLAIAGTSSIGHLDENIDAGALELSAGQIAALEEAAAAA